MSEHGLMALCWEIPFHCQSYSLLLSFSFPACRALCFSWNPYSALAEYGKEEILSSGEIHITGVFYKTFFIKQERSRRGKQ